MKLTKAQRGFLQALEALNTLGVYPNVLRVASIIDGGLSHGQTLYRYKICTQLSALGLVRNNGRGRVHELQITAEGLQALKEQHHRSNASARELASVS